MRTPARLYIKTRADLSMLNAACASFGARRERPSLMWRGGREGEKGACAGGLMGQGFWRMD